MLQTAFAQNINLKFTGSTSDGKYVQLDSIKVENTNRSWTETLVYPDTVLTLTNTTNISDVGNNNISTCLSYPNPFNGISYITLALPQSGNVSLQVYNIAGQQIMAKNLYMESGENHLEISLQHPQVYLLVAHTANGLLFRNLSIQAIPARITLLILALCLTKKKHKLKHKNYYQQRISNQKTR